MTNEKNYLIKKLEFYFNIQKVAIEGDSVPDYSSFVEENSSPMDRNVLMRKLSNEYKQSEKLIGVLE